MIRTRLVGTGHSVPKRIITNAEISKKVDTSDEWIQSRTGIRQRHVLSEGECTSDLASAAALEACKSAGISPKDLDCIVVATTTPDMPMPSCAVLTQQKIGAFCPAFDVAAACAGFTYGTTVVDALIRSGEFKCILFVGAEALSKFIDWEDRGTCILFGDGAGAVICVGEEQSAPSTSPEARGILGSYLQADGQFVGDLNIRGGGTLYPPSNTTVQEGMHYLRMNGQVIFTNAVRNLSDASEKALEKAGLSSDDIDLVIPHQANLRIIEAVSKRTRIPLDKFYINLEKYGNTSSASIPIALDEARREGRIQAGTLLLHCGLGAGLTWGAVVVRW